MKRKIFFLFIAALLAVAVLLTGCRRQAAKPKVKQPKKATKAVGHDLPLKEKIKLKRDVRADFKVIAATRDSTAPLKAALTKRALVSLATSIENDLQKGQIKIRRYSDLKVDVKNYNKPFAGVTVSYRDQSYYINSNTRKAVTEPTNERRRLILGVVKRDNRWKIADFLDPDRMKKNK